MKTLLNYHTGTEERQECSNSINLNDIKLNVFHDDIIRDIYKRQFTDDIMVNYYKERVTKRVTLQITDRCNLACTYCFQCNKGKKSMSYETATLLIESLADDGYFEDTDSVIIDFIGGESFLEVDLMDRICEYSIHYLKSVYPDIIIRFGTCSNGTLYFTEKVQKFIQKYKDILRVSFSIDGCKDSHDMCRIFPNGAGSYDLAHKAFLHYKNTYDSTSNVKLTISPDNVQYFYDSILSMIDSGITILQFGLTSEEGWTVEHARVYYQQLKKVADYIIDNDLFDKLVIPQFVEPIRRSDSEDNWCSANINKSLSMDPDGNLFTCIRFMQSSLSSRKPLSIGTVHDGIGQTEDALNNIQCIQCLNRRKVSNDKCYYCPISNNCMWCCAYSYEKYGDLTKRATFVCQMNIALSLINNYFLNRFAEKQQQNGNDEYAFNRLPLNCPYDWAVDIIGDEEYENIIKLSHGNRRRMKL